MGQIEVFDWLKNQRMTGVEDFFSPKEVFKGMVQSGIISINSPSYVVGSVSVALAKLEAYGYLEMRVCGRWSDWQRRYRIFEKYVSQKS